MAISESEQNRIVAKIRKRNKVAKKLNSIGPTVPIPMIPAAKTAENLSNMNDLARLERTLDAFLDAPEYIVRRGRQEIAAPMLAEMRARVEANKEEVLEQAETAHALMRERGILATGLPSNVDPSWDDRIASFALNWREPEDFTRPEYFRKFIESVYTKQLQGTRQAKFKTQFGEGYAKAFKEQVIPHLKNVEDRKKARAIWKQLKNASAEDFMNVYYTDINGDFGYIYTGDTDDKAKEVVQGVARMFGFELPY